MVELKPKSTTWNSLWSIMYCALVLGLQGYISFQTIVKFQESLMDRWKSNFPTALSACLALTILSLILTPIFIITSIFKVGNYANDGFKLGRDHALCQIEEKFVDKISSKSWRKLWHNFVPFSQTLHIIIAFLLLLPETITDSAEIYHGHKSSRHIWISLIDAIFDESRPTISDFMLKINQTTLRNMTSLIQEQEEAGTFSIQFVFFIMSLICFSVRYASVFWYTNKAFSLIFVFQLMLMSTESIVAYTGFSLLYKISDNLHHIYMSSVHLLLGKTGTMVLYFFSGLIMLLSTMTTFYYGYQHFNEKFRLLDRKHHPEKYKGFKRKPKNIFNGYVPHTCAVGVWILLTFFKGPIIYDLVSIYRKTSDALILSCVITEISFLIFWVVLWTLLTIKHNWLFRILDYANVGEPIFVIASNSLLSTPSMSVASIELKDIKIPRGRKSSSHPSFDSALDESGNDVEMIPACDEISLPLAPVRENPNADERNSIILRRSRNRRSGNRVTFHEKLRRNSARSEGSLHTRRCASPIERTSGAADIYYLENKRRSLPTHHRRSVSDLDRIRASPRTTPLPATPVSLDTECKVSNIQAAQSLVSDNNTTSMIIGSDKNAVSPAKQSKTTTGNNCNVRRTSKDVSKTRTPISYDGNTEVTSTESKHNACTISPEKASDKRGIGIQGTQNKSQDEIPLSVRKNNINDYSTNGDSYELSKYKQPDIVPKH